MPVDEILLNAEEKMQKTEEVVVREFAGVRTGKASPGLVENVLDGLVHLFALHQKPAYFAILLGVAVERGQIEEAVAEIVNCVDFSLGY